MRPDQLFVLRASTAILAMTIAGMLVRRRASDCWSFLAYCMAAAGGGFMVATWPDRFWTFSFYVLKESVYSFLKMVVAIEVAAKMFRPFVGARPVMLGGLGLVLLATLATLATAPHAAADAPHAYLIQLGAIQAQWNAGTIWLFTLPALLAGWYHLPIRPFHAQVSIGFGLYLGISAPLLQLVATYGPSWYPYLAGVDPVAYTATAGIWCLAAWRPVRESYAEAVSAGGLERKLMGMASQ
jgi:hypothetical protein